MLCLCAVPARLGTEGSDSLRPSRPCDRCDADGHVSDERRTGWPFCTTLPPATRVPPAAAGAHCIAAGDHCIPTTAPTATAAVERSVLSESLLSVRMVCTAFDAVDAFDAFDAFDAVVLGVSFVAV